MFLLTGGRDPTVEFASVTPTPVTVYEETATPVTTTVTVTFNEPRTDQVSGSNLWQMDLWFSKAKDGAGSSSDGVTNVLSASQSSKPVNFRNFVFNVNRPFLLFILVRLILLVQASDVGIPVLCTKLAVWFELFIV